MLSKRFIPKDSLVFRRIAEEVILVPIRKRAADIDKMYSINETGARIWELMDGKNTLEEIAKRISQEYDVEESVVKEDILELTNKLISIDAVEEVK